VHPESVKLVVVGLDAPPGKTVMLPWLVTLLGLHVADCAVKV